MVVLNESPYLIQLLRKKSFYNEDKIVFLSSFGFIYDYVIVNGVIEKTYKNSEIVSQISSLKNQIVIIATDCDNAGDFIAIELKDLLDKSNSIMRLSVPFEILFNYEVINEEILISLSMNSLNISGAKRYWESYLNNELKIETIHYLLDKHSTNIIAKV